MHMKSKSSVIILIFLILFITATLTFLYYRFGTLNKSYQKNISTTTNDDPLYQKFQTLSVSGNSSCSLNFKESIYNMDDTERLQGSCCSTMIFQRYKEQVEGMKKYANISQIPSDPYDITAILAKELLKYDEEITLTQEEQDQYNEAVNMSEEKGPCCCRCWRWYVYEGLGKYLIKNKGFRGREVAEFWNLSDGCGGDRHIPGVHS